MDPRATPGTAAHEVVPAGDDYRILTIMSEAIWKGNDSSSNTDRLPRAMLIGDSVRRAEYTLKKLREAGYEIVLRDPAAAPGT